MGRGTRRPGREQNITSPGCSFKSSAVAVWGTHHQSGAVAQQGGTMYLSRITLHTGQLSPAQLLHLVDRGEYVMHQWLWDLFRRQRKAISLSSGRTRGRFAFVLSQERPAESDIFTIECRPFAPELRTGQSLCFNLRANPTICKAGKRHDLLMEAKRQVRGRWKEVMSGCINNRRRWTGWQRRGKKRFYTTGYLGRCLPTTATAAGKLPATDPVQ